MNTVDRIMTICGPMPNALAHRHYLEQLHPRQQQARLDALLESEARHAGRWFGGRDLEQPGLTRARMKLKEELTNA